MTAPAIASHHASPAPLESEVGIRRRLDLGRLAMVPLGTALLLLNLTALAQRVEDAASLTVDGVARLLATALTLAFYAVVIVLYLRRGPAKSTTKVLSARVAAVVATWLPFSLPLLASESSVPLWLVLTADVLLLGGLAFTLWALLNLGRSLSIVAQARQLVRSGPYAWVRHPVYTGELVAVLGIVLVAPSVAGVAAWVVLIALQTYRTVHEERVLAEAFPQYAEYRNSTPRLLPGLP